MKRRKLHPVTVTQGEALKRFKSLIYIFLDRISSQVERSDQGMFTLEVE